MTEEKEPAKKPFYENIVAGRKRTQRPPKGDKGDRNDRAGRSDGGSRPSGDAHPSRDGRFAHDAPSSRDGKFQRDSRPARGPDRSERDGRNPRDANAPRGVSSFQGGRQGAYPARDAVRSDRGDRRDRGPRESARDERGAPGREAAPRSRRPFNAPESFTPIFGALSKETRALLDAFPEIVQTAQPLDSKRLQELPTRIRELSHELTDERSDRHVGYLNDPAELSAYVRYYMWWNLVRLSRLFATLPVELDDGDAAVDLGSGPLTLPIALWMSRPDLRKKDITWYCVDISQGALAAGEEIFLALAARCGRGALEDRSREGRERRFAQA